MAGLKTASGPRMTNMEKGIPTCGAETEDRSFPPSRRSWPRPVQPDHGEGFRNRTAKSFDAELDRKKI